MGPKPLNVHPTLTSETVKKIYELVNYLIKVSVSLGETPSKGLFDKHVSRDHDWVAHSVVLNDVPIFFTMCALGIQHCADCGFTA